jgi:transketolase
MSDLSQASRDVRRTILTSSKSANIGHIGCCLSVADLLAALYGEVLEIADVDDPERDRFVMSKGHAALALYAALYVNGRLTREQLESYCEDGSPVGGHPEHALGGIEFSTGSLGHGLSLAAGVALAARLRGQSYRTFALLSDAECNEGSVWEAAMFAAHHGLSNLVALVDNNGQQALGYTRDVLDLAPLAQRWRAFGWNVIEVDGHDPEQIASTVARLDTVNGPPHVLVAQTTFGKGVSFMEAQLAWHYQPMSEDEFRQAMLEVVGTDGEPPVARSRQG